jgi:hypothetical protein
MTGQLTAFRPRVKKLFAPDVVILSPFFHAKKARANFPRGLEAPPPAGAASL